MILGSQLMGTLLAAVLAATSGGITSPASVPAGVQMAIFQNIWKMDRNFDRNRVTTLAVLYQKENRASVVARNEIYAVVQVMDPLIRLKTIEVGTPELLRQAMAETDADVVYVTPLRAVDVSEIARISRRRRIRTITGVAEYVEAGIGVGIGIRKSRPLIFINLQGARAEGSDFEAQLLHLARIVGPAS
jgi:hypothetical protein